MTPAMKFHDLPCFRPKKQKLLAAILLLMEEAAKTGRSLTKGEIVKSLFLADDAHLAKYGRPITFDNYVAMQKGPVGDLASDMLNDTGIKWADFDLEHAPWLTKGERGLVHYSIRDAISNRKKLSLTDIDELVDALGQVADEGFDQISETSHRHPAWAIAWAEKAEDARAAAMDWRHFPAIKPERLSDLVMASWNA